MRRSFAFSFAVLACVLAAAAPAQAKLPPVKHVWVIVLENENQATSFGPNSPAPYLAKTLRSRGNYIPNYYGVTHASLGNYIAMISGQGSNPTTQGDCPTFSDFMPGVIGADGQAIGTGCVYPTPVQTLADQLPTRGRSWKGYMEDMGNIPSREASTCGHPALNGPDGTQSAKNGDQYATRHNPFVYFHSLLDSGACAKYDVSLNPLLGDLRTNHVPSFSFITPNLCDDGHDGPCADGKPGRLRGVDSFLRLWIPRITGSRAYHQGGMLIVLFDEAGSDNTSCCGEPQFPNTPSNGGPGGGTGGGKVGAVVLSPFAKPGSTTNAGYNHFSLLRSMEDLFGLSHLGYAGRPELKAFGSDVYNGPPCGEYFDLPFKSHGSYRRGTLIASARVSHHKLLVRMAHAARVSGFVGGRQVLSSRQLRLCRTYRLGLPRGHGRIQLRARRGAVERRSLRF
jgi:hypothetical protein